MKKIILFFLPFVYLFILLAQQEKAFTQDLGRHIKMGELILNCVCVPQTNMFSYTEPTHTFINHHWLSEVVFYLLYTFMGSYSLIVLKIFLVFLSFGLIYYFAFNKSPTWAFILSIPYIFILSERFDTRPELFSFLFLSLFIYLISRYRETRNTRLLYPLPFIELLWVNMHIYFVIGVVIGGMLLLDEIILKKRKIDMVVVVIILSVCFVTLVNSNGISGALSPFTILREYGYSIVENQNIFFLNAFFFNPRTFIFEILAVCFIPLLFVFLKKKDIFNLSSISFALYSAASMIRNFPIFVFTTFSPIVSVLIWLEKYFSRKNRVLVKSILLFLSLCLFLVTSAQALSSPVTGFSYIRGIENAVTFYQENNLKGPIFNNFDIGSYLIFRLYPKELVYVDGRPEAFSVAFFDEYKRMQEDPTLFKQLSKKHRFNIIFFAHTDITPWAQNFLSWITKDPEWVTIYLDERIIILVKNTPENTALIEQYKKQL